MSEVKRRQNPDDRPCWKRAHRNVSFRVAVALTLAAMIMRTMSDTFGECQRGKTHPPISAPIRKQRCRTRDCEQRLSRMIAEELTVNTMVMIAEEKDSAAIKVT